MKISELIENLKTKDQDAEVEFIVAKTSGELVCAQVKSTAQSMFKFLKMFAGVK